MPYRRVSPWRNRETWGAAGLNMSAVSVFLQHVWISVMTCYRAGIIREDDGSGCFGYFPDVPNVAALDARARARYL